MTQPLNQNTSDLLKEIEELQKKVDSLQKKDDFFGNFHQILSNEKIVAFEWDFNEKSY